MEKLNDLEINKIYNMDCLEGMKMLPDDSVDLLMTDPPYNISAKSNFHTMGRAGVDFGEWDKGFNQTGWLEAACKKIKKGGSAVVFNDYKNIGEMKKVFEKNGFLIKELIIWQKTNPMPRNRDRLYVTSIEVALWAVKGKGWVFNRERENYENAIFRYPSVNSKKRFHPTQKPQELIEDLVKIHSQPGDLILEPFSGSGSTALAALNTDRRFIGFELSEEYVKIAEERIKNLQTQETLF